MPDPGETPAGAPAPAVPAAAARPSSETRAVETRAAKRGFLFITGAKVWFLVCGTALNIGLPRLLGDPARYGDYGVVNTFISILNMVMITGALQVVAKRVSEQPAAAAAIRRRALGIQGVVALVVFVALEAGADLVASHVFLDPHLAYLVRIAAVITLAYGVYAVLIGTLNGLKRFPAQAGFDVLFATLKLALIVSLVLAGLGVSGAFVGFAAAAVIVTVTCLVSTRELGPDAGAPLDAPVPVAAFMFQVMGYTLMLNVLLQGDVIALKAAALEPVRAHFASGAGMERVDLLANVTGLDPAALTRALEIESTAALAGLYRATKNVALISYQAVIAITFVVFPLISRATFESDRGATTAYVGATVRTALLLVVFIGVATFAGGEPLLAFLFGDAYRLAAPALLPLVVAMVCFALFFVLASVLTAGGHPRDALLIAALAAVGEVGLLVVVIPAASPGGEVLGRAAAVALGASGLALALAVFAVVGRFGVRLPALSALRVGAAAAVAALATAPLSGAAGLPGIFVRVAVAVVVFGAALALTGEITRADLGQVRGIFRRREPR